MARASFFENKGPFDTAHLMQVTGARPATKTLPASLITDVAPIDDAGPGDITFLGDAKMQSQLAKTRAGACLVTQALHELVAQGTLALICENPELAFVQVLAQFYPAAASSTSWADDFSGFAGPVHPQARLEEGVVICPGALVCAQAEIGAGTIIGPNTVIGPKVKIGRGCAIGPNCSIIHALVGNRVIIHAGAALGQDGFGYTQGPDGLVKFPQIGRVVVQDDVEIGANCTIDRGAMVDTVIGEATKLDNLVQVAHNVVIGRHCAIAGQTGMSGSVAIGDGVMIGGQSGIGPHVTIGAGAQLAGGTGAVRNINPGERVAGRPHRPMKQLARELWMIEKLARKQPRKTDKAD
ncbi:MAG: UDP-3-O-(3-hydroxymyristoyl)glucosamine N-acyltransferase [Alphaproteobacteria bacterium]